ncbi:hypothetical protein IWW38_003332, partial [Coemansia aciculifera]
MYTHLSAAIAVLSCVTSAVIVATAVAKCHSVGAIVAMSAAAVVCHRDHAMHAAGTVAERHTMSAAVTVARAL